MSIIYLDCYTSPVASILLTCTSGAHTRLHCLLLPSSCLWSFWLENSWTLHPTVKVFPDAWVELWFQRCNLAFFPFFFHFFFICASDGLGISSEFFKMIFLLHSLFLKANVTLWVETNCPSSNIKVYRYKNTLRNQCYFTNISLLNWYSDLQFSLRINLFKVGVETVCKINEEDQERKKKSEIH